MTYIAAHVARNWGCSPLEVLSWPAEVLEAAVDVLDGVDPITVDVQDRQQTAAMMFGRPRD